MICGIPQESILSLLLFLICFNDFAACLRSVNLIKFDGNTAIYLRGKNFVGKNFRR